MGIARVAHAFPYSNPFFIFSKKVRHEAGAEGIRLDMTKRTWNQRYVTLKLGLWLRFFGGVPLRRHNAPYFVIDARERFFAGLRPLVLHCKWMWILGCYYAQPFRVQRPSCPLDRVPNLVVRLALVPRVATS